MAEKKPDHREPDPLAERWKRGGEQAENEPVDPVTTARSEEALKERWTSPDDPGQKRYLEKIKTRDNKGEVKRK